MDKTLLATGLGIEVCKQTAVSQYKRLYAAVGHWATEYDKTHQKPVRCSRDLLCEATRRHSKLCPSHPDYECPCWISKGERQPCIEGVM